MKNLIILSLALGLSGYAIAKEKKGAAEGMNSERLEGVTTHGEAVTQALVQGAAGKYSIDLKMKDGSSQHRDLKKKDFDFIVSEFEKLPVPPQVSGDCYRAKMEISYSKGPSVLQKKASCFGMKTSTEGNYIRFSQILTNAL